MYPLLVEGLKLCLNTLFNIPFIPKNEEKKNYRKYRKMLKSFTTNESQLFTHLLKMYPLLVEGLKDCLMTRAVRSQIAASEKDVVTTLAKSCVKVAAETSLMTKLSRKERLSSSYSSWGGKTEKKLTLRYKFVSINIKSDFFFHSTLQNILHFLEEKNKPDKKN